MARTPTPAAAFGRRSSLGHAVSDASRAPGEHPADNGGMDNPETHLDEFTCAVWASRWIGGVDIGDLRDFGTSTAPPFRGRRRPSPRPSKRPPVR